MDLLIIALLIIIMLLLVVALIMIAQTKKTIEELSEGLPLIINALSSLTHAENSIFEYLKKSNTKTELHDDGK